MIKLLMGFGLGYIVALVVKTAKESDLTGFVPVLLHGSKEEMDNVTHIDFKKGI